MATLEQQLVASLAAVNFKQGEKAMLNGKENGAGVPMTPTQVQPEEGSRHQERCQEQHSRTRLPADLARALHAPLPAEAIKPHPSKPYLSSVKAIFVIERLNEVFGIGGWTYRVHITESDPARAMVVVRVVLTVAEYGIRLEQFGGSDNEDRGDAYKGAVTDAISKIGSYLGIAMDVYKGGGPTKLNPRGMAVAQSAMAAGIDTGGHQVGTQAAADYVARQAIAAGVLRLQKPWSNRGEMREVFAKLREKVGEVIYLNLMARYGVNPTELRWRNTDQAMDAWRELYALAAKEVA